jgi:hypothetical protein
MQYATAHIENRISVLRSFILSLSASTSEHPIPPNALISPSALVTLSQIKRDVVETIRKVVDVVSKYAGGALPEPARDAVRGFILHLPERWADANQRQMSQGGSAPASTAPGAPPTTGVAKDAAGRVLTLAVESLDMLQGVAQVFGESLERAERSVSKTSMLSTSTGDLTCVYFSLAAGSSDCESSGCNHVSSDGTQTTPILDRRSLSPRLHRTMEPTYTRIRLRSVLRWRPISINRPTRPCRPTRPPMSTDEARRAGARSETRTRVQRRVDSRSGRGRGGGSRGGIRGRWRLTENRDGVF